MTCPHSDGDDKKGVKRRDFLISAVAIGGTSALSACVEREAGSPETGSTTPKENESNENKTPQEDTDAEEGRDWEEVAENLDYRNLDKSESQHAWNKYLRYERGVPEMPQHHILVLADYSHDGVPSNKEREKMEETIQTLEEAYEWSNEGLVFTFGYSPSYFGRFDASLPEEVDLPEPRALSPNESPETDEYDISIHLASDYSQAVLGAEEALFGDVDEVNGVAFEEDIGDILVKRERRTGFVGEGLPAENQDVDGIPDGEPVPEDSPLYMGFHTQHGVPDGHPFSGKTEAPFVHSQRSEYGVAIEEGPFAGGTTQQVSKIRLNLDEWYGGKTVQERLGRMFTPKERVEYVGEVAEDAGEENPFVEFRDEPKKDAEEFGMVGHAEKMARARTEDNVPLILRRDFDTTDKGHAGVHFVSLQRTISDFAETRAMMEGEEFIDEHPDIGEFENNGILEFIEVERRANFLVPPRRLRSLPIPEPDADGQI